MGSASMRVQCERGWAARAGSAAEWGESRDPAGNTLGTLGSVENAHFKATPATSNV